MLIMLLALFLVTMFLGTPIAFSMSFASIVTNLTHGASSLMLTAQQCYDSTSNLSLLAVPFFMLAGSIMNMGGISRRLINFCRLFVGRIRGGLAIVAVLAAMIFAAISGSGPATVAALGVFMIPTCSPWIFRPAPSIITCSPCACRRKTASSVSRISISATRSKRPWNSWKRPWNKKNSGRKNSPHQYRLPRGRCLLRPCFRVGRSKPCAGGDPLLSQDPSPG